MKWRATGGLTKTSQGHPGPPVCEGVVRVKKQAFTTYLKTVEALLSSNNLQNVLRLPPTADAG